MRFIYIFISALFLSCNSNSVGNTSEAPCEKPKDEFKMYEVSEMAALMEQMFIENKRLKDRILKRDTLGKFPIYFLTIEKASFTKGKDRDAFFKEQSDKFITKHFLDPQIRDYIAQASIGTVGDRVDIPSDEIIGDFVISSAF